MRLIRLDATVIAAALTFGLAFSPLDAPAQDLLDFLFGPETPAPASRGPSRYSDPRGQTPKGSLRFGQGGRPGGDSMSGGGYCVRTCDGYFFPLIKSSQTTRQQSCEFLCPSAPIELYEGASIEQARNSKGERYSALPAAFSFRDKTTKQCSCNDPRSSQAFFMRMARTDPTLRAGDVVVEEGGPFVYNGASLVTLNRASLPAPVRARLRDMLRRKTAPGETGALRSSEGAVAMNKAQQPPPQTEAAR